MLNMNKWVICASLLVTHDKCTRVIVGILFKVGIFALNIYLFVFMFLNQSSQSVRQQSWKSVCLPHYCYSQCQYNKHMLWEKNNLQVPTGSESLAYPFSLSVSLAFCVCTVGQWVPCGLHSDVIFQLPQIGVLFLSLLNKLLSVFARLKSSFLLESTFALNANVT